MLKSELSKRFVDVIPRAMQSIRSEIRDTASEEFTVPQFRILAYLGRHPYGSNSDLAEHIGVTAPSMSRMVELLVKKGMVERTFSTIDRRGVKLRLSEQGREKYESLRAATRNRFMHHFHALDDSKKETLNAALKIMEELFQ